MRTYFLTWYDFALRSFQRQPKSRLVALPAGHGLRGILDKVWISSVPSTILWDSYLVGAGPGDPELLTLKAARLLGSADIVLHDELVSPGILTLVPKDAELIAVGKRAGHAAIFQGAINELLVQAAAGHGVVVRLKGGDPFIFGRGGEELEFLRDRGIPVEIVPGITAALGCAAEIQLPLTFRSEATRLTLLTARTAKDATEIDFSGLGQITATLAIYMGKTSAAIVAKRLIEAGRSPETPAAVLANGTCPDSKALVGRLDQLPVLAALAGDGPALIVIGEVVRRSQPWREKFSVSQYQVA